MCSGKESKGFGKSLAGVFWDFGRACDVGERTHQRLQPNFFTERTIFYYLTLTTYHFTRPRPSTTDSTTTTAISSAIGSYIMALSRAGSAQSSERA